MLPCWCFGLHVKNVQKGIFLPPHSTAKQSWGWLRVVVKKLRLVLSELDRTRNKITAKAKAYWRGCAALLSGFLFPARKIKSPPPGINQVFHAGRPAGMKTREIPPWAGNSPERAVEGQGGQGKPKKPHHFLSAFYGFACIFFGFNEKNKCQLSKYPMPAARN